MKLRALATGLALAVLAAFPATAEEFVAGELRIVNPYAFASIGKVPNGAGFLTIENQGAAPDRLVGVESAAAERAELHGHEMSDGVMRMRPLEAVEVPANGTVALAPGGIHIMLIGLKAPLEAGREVPVELTFEHAGPVAVKLAIKKRGSGN